MGPWMSNVFHAEHEHMVDDYSPTATLSKLSFLDLSVESLSNAKPLLRLTLTFGTVRNLVYSYLPESCPDAHRQIMSVLVPFCLSRHTTEATVIGVPPSLKSFLDTSQQIRQEFLPYFWSNFSFGYSIKFFSTKVARLGQMAFDNLAKIIVLDDVEG